MSKNKRKKQLKRPSPPGGGGKIPPPALPKGLRFSYKYLELDMRQDGKFSISSCEIKYAESLLQRLKDLSGMTRDAFIGPKQNPRALRIHQIDWSKSSEDGFPVKNESLWRNNEWQFAISSNEHGRVHGFLLKDTFFIVWLDPNHRLFQ